MSDGLTGLRPEVADTTSASRSGPVILGVNSLTVDFGGVTAVDQLSFGIDEGTIVGLIGPNGAGKSTALTTISGQQRPGSGEVWFCGIDITGQPPFKVARRGLIRTFQLGGTFGRLTVMENLLMGVPTLRGQTLCGALAGRRWWRRSEDDEVGRARDLLATLGLTNHEDALAEELSGGQVKLVEIARAMMSRPKMLLLDEPMAGVNRTLSREIEQALQQLRDGGITLLLVEHELESVERMCDRVLVMVNGRLIADGPMGSVRSRREVLDAYLGA